MITFRRAVRESVPLIIVIAGATGAGKTYSAYRLATGLSAGKPFAMIDTENGRGKHYADEFVYDYAGVAAPFTPMAYADAIESADKAGFPVIVVDSFSHEHAGDGGLLDWHETELDRMAGQEWKRRDACSQAAWVKPKGAHKKMMSKLLQVKAHLILCLRAEQKIEMVRGEEGKMKFVPKETAAGFKDWIPICEKGLPFEATASFILTPNSKWIPQPIKLPEQLRRLININEPLSEDAGKKLAQWAKGEGVAAESSRSAPATSVGQATALQPADTLTPIQDLTISGWGSLLGAMENDPDLADLLTMVKEQCGLKSLAYPKVSPKDRVEFLTALRKAAMDNGLAARMKALGL